MHRNANAYRDLLGQFIHFNAEDAEDRRGNARAPAVYLIIQVVGRPLRSSASSAVILFVDARALLTNIEEKGVEITTRLRSSGCIFAQNPPLTLLPASSSPSPLPP